MNIEKIKIGKNYRVSNMNGFVYIHVTDVNVEGRRVDGIVIDNFNWVGRRTIYTVKSYATNRGGWMQDCCYDLDFKTITKAEFKENAEKAMDVMRLAMEATNNVLSNL